MHTLVYVDRELAVAIATKLVGLLLGKEAREGRGISLNWLIQSSISVDETEIITRDLREMLPEDVIYLVYDRITNKFENVPEAIKAFARSGDQRLLPGEVVSVTGQLMFSGLVLPDAFDPFSPPDIQVKTFNFHGEQCFVGRLSQEAFNLPVYFPETAKQQVMFAHSQPVEVTGIVRWSPPYSPGGASSLNLVMRAAALWLR